jgi:hypothetical protein
MALADREELEWRRMAATDLQDVQRPHVVWRVACSPKLTPWIVAAIVAVLAVIAATLWGR